MFSAREAARASGRAGCPITGNCRTRREAPGVTAESSARTVHLGKNPLTGARPRLGRPPDRRQKCRAAEGKSVLAHSATVPSSAGGSSRRRQHRQASCGRDSMPGYPWRRTTGCRPEAPDMSRRGGLGDPLQCPRDSSRTSPAPTPTRCPACRADPTHSAPFAPPDVCDPRCCRRTTLSRRGPRHSGSRSSPPEPRILTPLPSATGSASLLPARSAS